MDSIGLALMIGGFALVVSSIIFLVPNGRERSAEQAKTDESLEAINHYLREIRQQRNDYAERLLSGPDVANDSGRTAGRRYVARPAGAG